MKRNRLGNTKYDQQTFPEILDAINSEKYTTVAPVGRKYTSKMWGKWRKIYDESDNELKNFFYCANCSAIWEIDASNSGRCMAIHATHCTSPNESSSRVDDHFSPAIHPAKLMKISKLHKTAVKEAMVRFVVKDVRPIVATSGTGFIDIMAQMTAIGAKYGAMTASDLTKSNLLPSRFTVRNLHTLLSN